MDELPQSALDDVQLEKERLGVDSVESVGNSDELEVVRGPDEAPGPLFSQEEHHAKATKLLALLLFWALTAIFVAHFGSVVWLAHNRPNSVEEVTRVFNTWIPVFAGLFGSAATFYFTQGRKWALNIKRCLIGSRTLIHPVPTYIDKRGPGFQIKSSCAARR